MIFTKIVITALGLKTYKFFTSLQNWKTYCYDFCRQMQKFANDMKI